MILTWAERIANLADEVYQIDESGHLSRRPALASLTSGQGRPFDSSDVELPNDFSVAEDTSADNNPAQTSSKATVPNAVERQAAKAMLGDRTVYKMYFKSVGVFNTTVFILGAMACSLSFKFSGKFIILHPFKYVTFAYQCHLPT